MASHQCPYKQGTSCERVAYRCRSPRSCHRVKCRCSRRQTSLSRSPRKTRPARQVRGKRRRQGRRRRRSSRLAGAARSAVATPRPLRIADRSALRRAVVHSLRTGASPRRRPGHASLDRSTPPVARPQEAGADAPAWPGSARGRRALAQHAQPRSTGLDAERLPARWPYSYFALQDCAKRLHRPRSVTLHRTATDLHGVCDLRLGHVGIET